MDLAIVLYTISDDDMREEFSNELENQGFKKHPDQSTYTFPRDKVGNIFLVNNFSKWFEKWGKNKPWGENDFVSVYYLDQIVPGSKFTSIKNVTYSL